jgi:single-strand DNA-binding protein
VEGRLKYGKYTDQAGVEKYTTDIIVSELQLLGGREGRGEPPSEGGSAPRRAPVAAAAPPAASRQAPAQRPASGFDDMDDDIPF